MKTIEDGVLIPCEVIESRAFTELKPSAVKLLPALMTNYNGHNNGTIAFSYFDAEKFGITRETACRAFKDLQEKGFIRKTKQGGQTRGNVSEWLLTFYDDDRTGKKATNDWKTSLMECGV